MKRIFTLLFVVALSVTVKAQYTLCSPSRYVKASNTGAGDQFGYATALSADGLTMAVGAPYEDGGGTGINPASDELVTNSGAVYVYVRNTVASDWVFQAYIKASNPGANDNFGTSVVLSSDGQTLAIGSIGENGDGTGVNPAQTSSVSAFSNAGAVYVFTRSAGVWSQQAYIKASNTQGGDVFGFALALSSTGNSLAVSAVAEDGGGDGVNPVSDESANGAGAVYVYTRSGSSWSFDAYLKSPNSVSPANFGQSIAFSNDGQTLAVGEINESSNGTGVGSSYAGGTLVGSGAVHVFRRNAGVWGIEAYIKAINSGDGDNFGTAVSLSGDGNRLAVGALYEDGTGMGINPADNNAGSNTGAVYTYTRSGTVWSSEAYIKANNTGNDQFGSKISLSKDGLVLAVGSILEDGDGTGFDPASNELRGNSGAVYLYRFTGSSWTVLHYLKSLQNNSNADFFGSDVSLNGDGSLLVAGVRQEDGSGVLIQPASDELASNAGAVFSFAGRSVMSPLLAAYNSSATATVCDDGNYLYLKSSADPDGVRLIGRIFKNGNSFTVNSAISDVSSSGVFVRSLGAETAELMRRTLSISTTPSTGLTVNGGPIVRLYYDATELDNETGGYPVQQWIKYPGTRADMIDDLQHNGVRFSTAINPIASGVEGGVSYVDFQVTSFSVFAHLGASGTLLPVQLHSLSGRGDGYRGIIQLTWNTSSEQQSSHFEIEHSLTGTDFVQVGRVAAAGTSVTERRYAFAHATQVPGNHYYRLKQVDKDGRYVYSGMIKVQLTAGEVRGVVLYPVPAKDQVQLQLTDNKYAGQTVQLLTAQGQLLRQVLLQGNRVSIDLRGMAAGVYVLRLPDGNVQRFVKE